MTVGGSPAVIDSVNSGLPQAPSEAVYIINRGAVAQLGEHLLCMQGVRGSSPLSSTRRDQIKNSLNIWDSFGWRRQRLSDHDLRVVPLHGLNE